MNRYNPYALNTGGAKYVKQILIALKGKISSNTIIVGELSTPLMSVGRLSRQKTSKKTLALHDT